jgi:TatD DNase family protein
MWGMSLTDIRWIDSHCHLDAAEFDSDRSVAVARAHGAGVTMQVLPAVQVGNFDTVRGLAHEHGLAYALGIHPMCVDSAADDDLGRLRQALQVHRDDPRLVAIGETGLDHFLPGLDRARQERFFVAHLQLAREFGLPVIMHVRRSGDTLLKHLRRIAVPGGIAHAFNGSLQQARFFAGLGFRLGFGGAMTFERALQIRRIAADVADNVPVLETDAPDIPPYWLYRTAAERAAGVATAAGHGQSGRNEPAELPRIARTLAALRGWSIAHTAHMTVANTEAALPRLRALRAAADAPADAPAASATGSAAASAPVPTPVTDPGQAPAPARVSNTGRPPC